MNESFKQVSVQVCMFGLELTSDPWSLSCSCRGMHCQWAYTRLRSDMGWVHTLLSPSHSALRCTGGYSCMRTLADRQGGRGNNEADFITHSEQSVHRLQHNGAKTHTHLWEITHAWKKTLENLRLSLCVHKTSETHANLSTACVNDKFGLRQSPRWFAHYSMNVEHVVLNSVLTL